MKKKLMAMLAAKEARMAALKTNATASKDVAELRSINVETETLNSEIVELRSMIAGLPDETVTATSTVGMTPEQITAAEQRSQMITQIQAGAGTLLPNPMVSRQAEQRSFENMEREERLATPEYRSAFYKHLQGKSLNDVEKRAYDTSTTAVIPTESSNILFQKMVKVAPLINEITLLRVAGNIKFAVEGTRDAAIKHTENAAITPAGDTLVYVSLGGYDFTKLIIISKSVQTMAISAFEGWLTDMLSQDIAVKIEDVSINGTGNSEPKGVANAATWTDGINAVEYTKGGSPTYDNVVDLISDLPARYSGNAKFLCNNKFLYGMLAKIKDDQKRPILVQDFSNPIAQRVLGFPILISDKVPAGTLFFGDYKQMVGNLAQDVMIETDMSAGFDTRSVHYLGSAIYDCSIALTDAFCKMSESAT